MKYRCGFCPAMFPTLTDLALHREHEHPEKIKSAYAYFEALQKRYSHSLYRKPGST